MTVYPAIDIRNGRAVRLLQGRADQETVYAHDPLVVATQFAEAGSEWVHVVDLDGAFAGAPRNLSKVTEIVKSGLKVQMGGGQRSWAIIEETLAAGVRRVVVGTKAVESLEFVAELVARFGDRIAIGIDARNGKVAVKGWVDTTDRGAIAFAQEVDRLGIQTIINTDIGTDGMLTGPNLAAQETMAASVTATVIASGGIACRQDVVNLVDLEKRHPNLSGVIVGKAIYEKRVTIAGLLAIPQPAD